MDTTPAQNDGAVEDYLASLDDEHTLHDSRVLIEMLRRISGHQPRMWNTGTLGFDTYHYQYDSYQYDSYDSYQYDSGREGDGHVLGFYPRKGKITVYLMDGTARYAELLAKVGRQTYRYWVLCLYQAAQRGRAANP
jgi:hypothetical protein